jgi:hypothetical protein
VEVFHKPDVARTILSRFCVAGRYANNTGKTDQCLFFRCWMNRLIPSSRQLKKHHACHALRLRDKYALCWRGKGALFEDNFHISPMTFTRVIGVQVMILQWYSPT